MIILKLNFSGMNDPHVFQGLCSNDDDDDDDDDSYIHININICIYIYHAAGNKVTT